MRKKKSNRKDVEDDTKWHNIPFDEYALYFGKQSYLADTFVAEQLDGQLHFCPADEWEKLKTVWRDRFERLQSGINDKQRFKDLLSNTAFGLRVPALLLELVNSKIEEMVQILLDPSRREAFLSTLGPGSLKASIHRLHKAIKERLISDRDKIIVGLRDNCNPPWTYRKIAFHFFGDEIERARNSNERKLVIQNCEARARQAYLRAKTEPIEQKKP